MSEPKYRQIAEELRQDIRSGALAPGSQLATELDLRERHDASRNTVRDAMALLVADELVEHRQGQGMFVVENFSSFVVTLSGARPTDFGAPGAVPGGGEGEAAARELAESAQTFRASDPQVAIEPASHSVARHLQIACGVPVISRRQRLSIDDQPWALQTSYYPKHLTERAQRLIEATDIKEGTVTYLAEELGLVQVGYRDQMLSGTADEHAQRFFGLAKDSRAPVCLQLRTAYTEVSGRLMPFRLTRTVYLFERNQFVIEAGRVPQELAQEATG